MRIATTALLVMLVLSGCPKRPPQFSPRVAELRRVAIVPVDVSLIRIVFNGDDEPLLAEAETARRELPLALGPELERHGFTVVPARLDEADLAAAPELRYPLTLARAGGTAVASNLMQGKRSGSLGPQVGQLAEHAGADALLVVVLAGMAKSGGQVARDAAVTILTLGSLVYRTSATRLFIALVDGTSGVVHWYGWTTTDSLVYEGAALRDLAHVVLKDWPSLPPAGTPPGPASP
jgi:hypothetical protein